MKPKRSTDSAAGDALQSIARVVGLRRSNRSLRILAKAGQFDFKAFDEIDAIILRLAVELERKTEQAAS
jgi:hypothetical protein